jgi:hypothetical protein
MASIHRLILGVAIADPALPACASSVACRGAVVPSGQSSRDGG